MEALRAYPNVHSVGIGGRERAGKPTGELVLKVFVHRKVSLDSLGPGEKIPVSFEGVPIDVVEAPEPKVPATAVAGAVLGSADPDEGRYRPLRGGIQIGSSSWGGLGTLGFMFRVDEPPPERVFAVTNHHVLFSSVATEVAGTTVGQPTADDSVTKCCRGVFGAFVKGYRDNTLDAAIALIERGTEYYPQIEEIGVIAGDHDVTQAEALTLTYQVKKRGRTTRLTGGTIQSINTINTNGWSGYMVVKPNAAASGTATFADHGDSGSAVLNESNEIVGLLWAVASLVPGQSQVGWGFAWPIDVVKSRFAADGLSLLVEAGTTLDEKRVANAGGAIAAPPPAEPSVLARRVETDLSDSDLGRALTGMWLRHSVELNRLVNNNRAVTARWYRSGGAALFQSGLRAAYDPTRALPAEIDGRSADECLQAVLDLFHEYGSVALRADINTYRALLPSMAGRSYGEILAALRGDQEMPWRH